MDKTVISYGCFCAILQIIRCKNALQYVCYWSYSKSIPVCCVIVVCIGLLVFAYGAVFYIFLQTFYRWSAAGWSPVGRRYCKQSVRVRHCRTYFQRVVTAIARWTCWQFKTVTLLLISGAGDNICQRLKNPSRPDDIYPDITANSAHASIADPGALWQISSASVSRPACR